MAIKTRRHYRHRMMLYDKTRGKAWRIVKDTVCIGSQSISYYI
jgi:hypothetical protein